jgi:D-aminopeptidase
VIAFATAQSVRRPQARPLPNAPPATLQTTELANDETSALYEAVVEATEEAIYNSLFMATTTTARGHTVPAIPLDSVRAILSRYKVTTR